MKPKFSSEVGFGYICLALAILSGLLFSDISKLQVNYRTLSDKYDLLRFDFKKIQDQNIKLKKDLEETSSKIAMLESEKQELNQKLDATKTDFEKMEVQAQRLEVGMKNIKEEKIYLEDILIHKTKEIEALKKQTVDLGAISVGAASSAPFQIKTNGKIQALNLDQNIVIVDIGKINGIQEKTAFLVKRNNSVIASINAIELRDVMTACKIDQINKGEKLQVGDEVVVAK